MEPDARRGSYQAVPKPADYFFQTPEGLARLAYGNRLEADPVAR